MRHWIIDSQHPWKIAQKIRILLEISVDVTLVIIQKMVYDVVRTKFN